MKIAQYKGMYYIYNSNKRTCSIVTTRNEKIHDGFIFEDGAFFKSIQENDVQEIFEIYYRIKYDAGVKGVSTEWDVGCGIQDINNDKILIRYSNGVLPGWNIEEKNVCIKYVDKEDIEYGEVIKIFHRKNGVTLTAPEKTVDRVDVDTLISVHKEYQRNNL